MSELVTETVGGEPYEYYPLGSTSSEPPASVGAGTFKYTRIEITGALERLAAGERVEEISRGYEGRVPPEALMEAVTILTRRFLEGLPRLAAAS